MEGTLANLVRRAEYAHLRGITAARISQLEARGLLRIVSGRVDVDASDELIGNALRPRVSVTATRAAGTKAKNGSKGSNGHGGSAVNLIAAQARAAEARAKLTELKVRQVEGELVEFEEVAGLLQTAFTEVRMELLQLPERLAARLLDVRDENAARLLLDRDIRAPLMRCADRLRKFVQLDRPGI